MWQDTLTLGQLAEVGHEDLTAAQELTEQVMLEVRLRDGLSLGRVGFDPGRSEVAQLLRDGLVREEGLPQQLVLTIRGRLLADMVTLRLLEILGR